MIESKTRPSVGRFLLHRCGHALLAIGALTVVIAAMLPSCEPNPPPADNLKTDTLYDTEYLRHTYYRIDTLPLDHAVTDLRVYVDDANPNNNVGTLKCLATIRPDDPADTSMTYSHDRHAGYFDLKLVTTDYLIDPTTGVLEFTPGAISSNYTIGVSYVSGTETVGGYQWFDPQAQESLLVLKLIKPERADLTSLTWGLEMRNVYNIGVKDIDCDSVRLFRRDPDGYNPETDENGSRFLHLVGLDPDNDGFVEWPQLDTHRGYMICDNPFPFVAESLTVKDSIYRLNYPEAYHNRRYYLVVKYSVADSAGVFVGRW